MKTEGTTSAPDKNVHSLLVFGMNAKYEVIILINNVWSICNGKTSHGTPV